MLRPLPRRQEELLDAAGLQAGLIQLIGDTGGPLPPESGFGVPWDVYSGAGPEAPFGKGDTYAPLVAPASC